MPKLSLYRSQKSNDYHFFDKNISEMFDVGGTDLYIHKYLGVTDSGPSRDKSQPRYDKLDPTSIQDLLFLENRDRKYDTSIYRLRGHYNVQNLDFDLSQFGLFLNNDVIFVTVHYNKMIELIGRKLMVGDVFELPHLTDYHPLNELIPTSLRRYYQITDANFASEGFSSTWYPHLWRVKCEPLVDSQEFSNILKQPTNTDTYLGDWDKTTIYPAGYVVSYGDKNYVAKSNVPVGTPCTDTTYWELDSVDNLKDILGRYNKNIAVNEAMIAEAKRILPTSGYNRSQLYVAPTDTNNKPAAPKNLTLPKVAPRPGVVTLAQYGEAPVIRITISALKDVNEQAKASNALKAFVKLSLELAKIEPEKTSSGSGSTEPTIVLTAKALGDIVAPYGTSDNTYSTADQDPTLPSFTGTIVDVNIMDFRADEDPRFTFVPEATPRGLGYTNGYMVGDGTAPNGVPFGSGITFPVTPKTGDYFLRLDYLPQQLFRWDGSLWVKISENVQTDTGFGSTDNQSQMNSFINNNNQTTLVDGTTINELQGLSSILNITPD
jgi:hypothetical protein